ncbi:hypothetical protein [Rhizobium tubonense]|uniref:Uncharacterized protein n=1 Tax=Rhizobium tubonense TaxID=484088 RepID=A0A2W4CC89_9HYPH|nr:hypothetical protein CPY51_21715 [Rhizobium tubonense]
MAIPLTTNSQINLTGEVQSILLVPDGLNEWGIVVLGGSSGRIDVQRASLFASLGIKSLALRWFGAEGLLLADHLAAELGPLPDADPRARH